MSVFVFKVMPQVVILCEILTFLFYFFHTGTEISRQTRAREFAGIEFRSRKCASLPGARVCREMTVHGIE